MDYHEVQVIGHLGRAEVHSSLDLSSSRGKLDKCRTLSYSAKEWGFLIRLVKRHPFRHFSGLPACSLAFGLRH